METTQLRQCKAINCTHFTKGGCVKCVECDAPPYNINPNCRKCFECENRKENFDFQEYEDELKQIKLITAPHIC
jgi:hypothetical protein